MPEPFILDPRERHRNEMARRRLAEQAAAEADAADAAGADYSAFRASGPAVDLSALDRSLPSTGGAVTDDSAARGRSAGPDPTMMETDAALSEAEQTRDAAIRSRNATREYGAQVASQRARGGNPNDPLAEDKAGEVAAIGSGLVNDAEAAAGQYNVNTGPRPFHKPVKAHTDTMGKLLPESREAAVGVQQAQLAAAQQHSVSLQEEADVQQRLDMEMHAREIARQKRTEEVMLRQQKSDEVVQKSAADALKASDIDPDRGWGEKGVGAKIAAILAAGFLGFAGLDPMQHINSVIQNSLDAQKYNRDQARAKVGVAREAHQAALNDYDAIRTQVGDEAVADAAFWLRSLQVIRAQAAAKLADAGVTELSKQQQSVMNAFDQQIAERQLIKDKTVEANTPMVTTVSPKLTGDLAKMNMAKHKAGLGMMEKGAEGVVRETGNRQAGQRTAGIEIEKGRQQAEQHRQTAAQQQEHGPHGTQAQLETYVKETKPHTSVVSQIDAILKKYPKGTDIPGHGFASGQDRWAWGEDAEVKAAVNQVKEEYGRYRSQGQIGGREEENFDDQFFGGVDIGGDERLRQNLQAIRDAVDSQRVPFFEILSPEAQERVTRNKHLAPRPTNVGPSGVEGQRPEVTTLVED